MSELLPSNGGGRLALEKLGRLIGSSSSRFGAVLLGSSSSDAGGGAAMTLENKKEKRVRN